MDLIGLMLVAIPGAPLAASADCAPQAALQAGLDIEAPKLRAHDVSIDGALRLLNVPAAGVALIDDGKLVGTAAFGPVAHADTLYQAASLSKVVAAVAALRLVDRGLLSLDDEVNRRLQTWHVPASPLARDHPVTLRGLLSMTGGIGVPGYIGYPRGAPLPTLIDILDGRPPADSPPVRVEYVPGTEFFYSGGGYEIVQALITDVTGKPFGAALQDLVLGPVGMTSSTFEQPPSDALRKRAADGHFADGTPLPGGFHLIPELAAGGLWSTPADLARLLIALAEAYRGAPGAILRADTARVMFERQNGFHYGLGGAISGEAGNPVLMKRGQNVGYQSYLILVPRTGRGGVVMTGSDNGSILADAILRRFAEACGWPELGPLPD